MSTLAIIPARYGATRLPGKPLSDVHGKPLNQYVWERARAAAVEEAETVAADTPADLERVRALLAPEGAA